MLVAHYGNSYVYWADNDGSQSFSELNVASITNPWDAYPADVDDDGDVDVAGRAETKSDRRERPLDARRRGNRRRAHSFGG